MTEVTTIQTRLGRKIIVTADKRDSYVFLDVNDTREVPDDGNRVFSMLKQEEAKKLAGALLGNNSAVIMDLPVAELDSNRVYAGNADRNENADPAELEQLAKNLLAIAKFIRKANAEKEAAEAKRVAEAVAAAEVEKAREEKLTARRDELAKEFAGRPDVQYLYLSEISRKAVDRVVELEDAAAPKFVL